MFDFLDPTLLVSLAIASLVFVVFLIVGMNALSRREINARIKAAAGPPTLRQHGSRPSTLRSVLVDYANDFADRINLVREQQGANVRKRLVQAGLRSQDSFTLYIFSKIALPVGLGMLGFVYLFGLASFGLGLFPRVAIILGIALAGSYLPDLLIKNWTDRRQTSIRKALPDALDLLVICAESGLSLDAGLQRVAREMSLASKELSEELQLTVIELRFMPERRRPLENLAERVDLPAVRNLVNALLQAEKYGSPISRALRTISEELREERMMRAEDKAARLPALMTIPLILFILPALFIVILGPAALDIIDMFAQV